MSIAQFQQESNTYYYLYQFNYDIIDKFTIFTCIKNMKNYAVFKV